MLVPPRYELASLAPPAYVPSFAEVDPLGNPSEWGLAN